MSSIELLAPAGSPEALDAAIGEGADAVYLGLKDFNARLRSANFTYAQFEAALRSLRRMGKKVYVTVNTVFEQREADRIYQFLKYLAGQGPDAIIVQDFGVIEMCKSQFPSLKLHASTQMNIASARGANALSRHGVSRVVLARELTLEELRNIKKETNLELEVFVHGALCISVSGICLFSSFLGGKSANRGMCTQACRRLYHRLDRSEGEGYYFSPNDLQLLERVPDLAEAGIKAIKIEGRMKSASYVGAVVSAYRLIADAVTQGDEDGIQHSIEQGQKLLQNDFARPKTQYLFGGVHTEAQRLRGHGEEGERENNKIDWLDPQQDGGTGISLGKILKFKNTGEERLALVTPPRGVKLSVRDSVRVHRSDDSGRISQKLIFVEKASGGLAASSFWISAPEDPMPSGARLSGSARLSGGARLGDNVYLIQTKEMRKRYENIITQAKSSKGPGRDKAPYPEISITKKTEVFPEGIYITVSRPEDLYIVQSSRPKRVILTLSRKNAKYLLAGKEPLPFKPAEIILSLNPFFPQDTSQIMLNEIEELTKKGYLQYIVNNPGQFSLFRGKEKTQLIAGPFLYTFNSWSLSFVSGFGTDGFVSPLENNRQNLERTCSEVSRAAGVQKSLRKKFFITVFAYPPLFTIRENLTSVLGFNAFADNKDEAFSLDSGYEGSFVYPKKHFSIIDKIPFLKEAGFGRFIVDLSGSQLKKTNYKDLMRAINENNGNIRPLPNSSRFNWKDGFYKA
ncbi:MAG: U32 family peptidase [Treponema sp.]|nr:U32 family peptidase [Treponema sp.]